MLSMTPVIRFRLSSLIWVIPLALLALGIIVPWVIAYNQRDLPAIAPWAVVQIIVLALCLRYIRAMMYWALAMVFRDRNAVYRAGRIITYMDKSFCTFSVDDVDRIEVFNEGNTRTEYVRIKLSSSDGEIKIQSGQLEGGANAVKNLIADVRSAGPV